MRRLAAAALLAAACGSSPRLPPPTGWQALAPLPSPRQEVAAAALDGDLYVVGGLVVRDGGLTGTAEALRYRPAAGAWERLPDYPLAVDHAAAAAAAGKVYVLGGSVNFQPSAPLAKMYAFDPQRGVWEPRADLPRARWAPAAAFAGGRIVAGGGIGGAPAEVHAYDPASDTWETLAGVALTPRDHLGAAAVGGRVYFVGGRQGVVNLDVVEEVDPAAHTLRARAKLPTARGGIGVAALGSSVYAIGGEGSNAGASPQGVFPQVEIYDAASDGWRSGPSMRTPRHGLGVVTAGAVVYALGGGTVAGVGPSDVAEALFP